jgi:hypothetical protein
MKTHCGIMPHNATIGFIKISALFSDYKNLKIFLN